MHPDPRRLHRFPKRSSQRWGRTLWALALLGVTGSSGCRCGEPPRNKRPPPRAPDVAGPEPLPVEIDRPDASSRLIIRAEREPNNWPEQAQTIREDHEYRGFINYPLTKKLGDRDLYCFEFPGPDRQVLRAELTGVPRLKLKITVRDKKRWGQLYVGRSTSFGRDVIVPNLSLKPGKYCLLISEARGGPPHYHNRDKPYRLRYRLGPLRDGEERERNDHVWEAVRIKPGQTIRGLIGRPGDVDWYRIGTDGLATGSLLSITYKGVGGVTADISVMDAAQRKIVQRRGTRGATVHISNLKVPLHAGLFYVQIKGKRRFNPDDHYELRIASSGATAGREVEPNDTPRQAVPVRGAEGEIRGVVEVAHDIDYYRLKFNGQANIRIRLTPPSALDARITVFNGAGRRIADSNIGKTGEPELLTNVRAIGSIRIKVSGAGRSYDARRPYRLQWSLTPADKGDEKEPNNTPKRANGVRPGVSARGYIFPRGDRDLFRFRLPGVLGATQKIRISVQGIPQVRVKLTLLDDQNNVLAQRRLPTTEGLREITTTLHAAKLYYVRIEDEHGRRVNATDNYELILARMRRGP